MWPLHMEYIIIYHACMHACAPYLLDRSIWQRMHSCTHVSISVCGGLVPWWEYTYEYYGLYSLQHDDRCDVEHAITVLCMYVCMYVGVRMYVQLLYSVR